MAHKEKFYVIFIWGDVEPQTHGPFDKEEARDGKALELRRENSSEEGGIYPAVVSEDGQLVVDCYSGAFFESVDEEIAAEGVSDGN